MSEFEYYDEESDKDVKDTFFIKKLPAVTAMKVSKELNLRHSKMFIDCFNLIYLFVKDKRITYKSFLEHFDNTQFHHIFAKPPKKYIKQMYITPHHYITIAQDALAATTMFLRSGSKKARIGAVYLMYTLYRTQPLKRYIVAIKMKPEDYESTKELVISFLKENVPDPAYYFYELDVRKKIIITASSINPCLEVNYPRLEIRKHMGRIADKYFGLEYEERKEFEPLCKLRIMEYQLRDEWTYLNKLSNEFLGNEIGPEYKIKLSYDFESLIRSKDQKPAENNTNAEKPLRKYKMKKFVAFPGRNDHILQDMVTTQELSLSGSDDPCPEKEPKKKRKRRRIEGYINFAALEKSSGNKDDSIEDICERLTLDIDSDSSFSNDNSDDNDSTNDNYENIMQQLLDKSDANGVELSNAEDGNDD